MTERRLTREDAEAARDRIAEALASGDERAEIRVGDSDVVLEKDPSVDGAFVLTTGEGAFAARVFPASAAPPPAYPDGMPFIPGEPVTVSTTDGTVSLIWWAPASPEAVVQGVEQQCVADGWTRVDGDAPHGPFQHLRFTRHDVERMLLHADAIVTLIQTGDASGARP